MTFDEPGIEKLMNAHSKLIGSDHQSWDGDYPSALREILRLRGWLEYIRNAPRQDDTVFKQLTVEFAAALAGDPAPGTEAT